MAAGTVVRVPRKLGYEQARHEALARTAKVVDGTQVVLTIVRTRCTRSAYVFEVA